MNDAAGREWRAWAGLWDPEAGVREAPRAAIHRGSMLLLVTLSCWVAGCDRPKAVAKGSLSIVVSGDTAGWLMPCGCTSSQSGGLLRRGTYLSDLRKSGAVIYLDAGGAAGGTSAYHREKFESILAGEQLMGAAAHNLGGSELALGADYLREVAGRTKITFVSANATDGQGAAMAPASVELPAGDGRSVLVVGVVSPRFATAGIHISDPRQAVLNAIGAGRKENRWVVVLAYLPEEELTGLASALPEVDAVIGGPTGQAVAPHAVGPVLVGAATNKGKFVVCMNAPRSANDRWDGTIVELGPKFADAADQQRNVAAYLDRLARRDFSAAESGLIAPLPAGTPADYRIAGSASCQSCHGSEQAVWSASGHGHAFATLRQKGFHVDSYCQSCHTTGYGLPGGFERLSASAARLDVGCENCHGPSAAHVQNPKVHTPFVASDQCTRCHDHENSPKFDYAQYWPRIAHGKKGGAKP